MESRRRYCFAHTCPHLRPSHSSPITIPLSAHSSPSRPLLCFETASGVNCDADMNIKLQTFRALSTRIGSQSSVNSQIKSLVQQSEHLAALKLFSPATATNFTFPPLLKACTCLSNLEYGKIIHSAIVILGLQHDPYITTSLITFYWKCGSLDDAVNVFDNFPGREEVLAKDVTIWNSVIDGYFRYGNLEEGIARFRQMQLFGLRPDEYSLSILLGACGSLLGSPGGKQIHGFIIRNIYSCDAFLETALIDMYLSCSRPMEACLLFDDLEDRGNVVVWNVMIGGLCQNGMWDHSLELYSLAKKEIVDLASTSFTSALSACCYGENVDFGRQLHCDVIKQGFHNDSFVFTSLLTMYTKCRLVEDAEVLFTHSDDRKIEAWNAMISGYVGNGRPHNALEVYCQMKISGICSDSITLSNILSACSMVRSHNFGRSVHAELIKRPMQSTIALQSSILTMYSKCESHEDAHLVFSNMTEKDVVAWGSMISGLCQNMKYKEAFELFKAMETDGLKPDSDIMVSIINSCPGLEDVHLGCGVHGLIIKSGHELDIFVATSLIDMYSKFSLTEMAAQIFSGMPFKNLVGWNSLMSCYCRNELPETSITIFSHIMEQKLKPDNVSVTTVLSAVSSLASLLKGKAVHGYLIRLGNPLDLQVRNALIDMYMKCGCLKYSQNIFQNMIQRNLVTWNSMIIGCGYHGHCCKALMLFDEMRRLGVIPDRVSFVSLISSCRHSGLVKEGLRIFDSMRLEYGIEPRTEDYVSVVDLLGRAGQLEDAYRFIQSMPDAPDRSVWLCLLSFCRVHSNVQLGEIAASKLLESETAEGSNFVPLLNLYGGAELWDRAANLRASMKEKGLKKNPGCSWIELKDRVEVFYSGDPSSPKGVDVYEVLVQLSRNMEKRAVDHRNIAAF
ncbi:pentatricopeptide repeat-containing protein At2g40720 [Punica granatum]|uniref:Pentatricopeptide repeat-containing protein At2g40720 n=1 Tax=Punica granatum TaxID=22663 RepID=A0A6P8BQI5_PUNGR|nr:pentatricopeptide repeat-containing protein At2g40720 [Punica granatum]